jgi:hypothetical protein
MLRAKLTEITNELDISRHEDLVRTLAQTHSHTVTVIPSDNSGADYNCVMYALDLVGAVDPPTSLVIGRYHMDLRFLKHLTDNHLTEVDKANARGGDLVVYYQNEEMLHVGVLTGEQRVTSKWGPGLLYDHGLWEVPDNYGDSVRYFRSEHPDVVFELFKQYFGVR